MNWWRLSKRPEDHALAPDPVHTPDSEVLPPQKHDPLFALQRSVGNQAVQKLLPTTGSEPVPEAERKELETSFDEDLGDVRIHRDEDAGELAADAGATAFTVGRDIYFASGAYSSAPLAHEVSHVIQQSQATSFLPGEDATLEHQANVASSAFVSGHAAEVSSVASAPAMQRQPAPGKQTASLKLPRYSLTLDDFDIDKSKLHSKHEQMLDEFAEDLADILSSTPGAHVMIVGFADAPGSESHNQEIGQERADSVRDYLIKKGVPEGALRTHSAGAGSPLIPGKGYQAKNRRVEIVVSDRVFKASEALAARAKPAQVVSVPRPEKEVQHDVSPPMQTAEEAKARHDVKEDEKVKEARKKKDEGKSSISDRMGQKAREIAKSMGLPKSLQDRAESLGKDLPSKGAQALIDQIGSDQGLSQAGKDALKGIVDSLAHEKW